MTDKTELSEFNKVWLLIRKFSSSGGVCFDCGCAFLSYKMWIKELIKCELDSNIIAKIAMNHYLGKKCYNCCKAKGGGCSDICECSDISRVSRESELQMYQQQLEDS